MEELKYNVYVHGDIAAENMDLDTAVILVKALFEKYYADTGMVVSMRRRVD